MLHEGAGVNVGHCRMNRTRPGAGQKDIPPQGILYGARAWEWGSSWPRLGELALSRVARQYTSMMHILGRGWGEKGRRTPDPDLTSLAVLSLADSEYEKLVDTFKQRSEQTWFRANRCSSVEPRVDSRDFREPFALGPIPSQE